MAARRRVHAGVSDDSREHGDTRDEHGGAPVPAVAVSIAGPGADKRGPAKSSLSDTSGETETAAAPAAARAMRECRALRWIDAALHACFGSPASPWWSIALRLVAVTPIVVSSAFMIVSLPLCGLDDQCAVPAAELGVYWFIALSGLIPGFQMVAYMSQCAPGPPTMATLLARLPSPLPPARMAWVQRAAGVAVFCGASLLLFVLLALNVSFTINARDCDYIHAAMVFRPAAAWCRAGDLDRAYIAVTTAGELFWVGIVPMVVAEAASLFAVVVVGAYVRGWADTALARVDAVTQACADLVASRRPGPVPAASSLELAHAGAAVLDEWIGLRERCAHDVPAAVRLANTARAVPVVAIYVTGLGTVASIWVMAGDAPQHLLFGVLALCVFGTRFVFSAAVLTHVNSGFVYLRKRVSARPPPPTRSARAALPPLPAPPRAFESDSKATGAVAVAATAADAAAYVSAPLSSGVVGPRASAGGDGSASVADGTEASSDVEGALLPVAGSDTEVKLPHAVLTAGSEGERAQWFAAEVSLRTTLAMGMLEEYLETAVVFMGVAIGGGQIMTASLLLRVLSALSSLTLLLLG